MNISPDYQREVVWTTDRMIHLVDSLFNNFYVPPLIFKVITGTGEEGKRRAWRTCIDGKQRLTTIQQFFDGDIPYKDKLGQRWYYTLPPGTSGGMKRLLSEEQREFINNVNLVNIEFDSINEEQEEDMFQRVQLGIPLSVAERLAALTGLIPSFVTDVRKSYTNIPILVGTKRAIDFKLIAQLIYLMYCRIEEEEELKITSSTVLTTFLKEKNMTHILTPAFRSQVRRVFTTYNELILTHKDVFSHTWGPVKTKNRRFSPVEFLGAGILLDMYPDRPMAILADDIKEFRIHLRTQCQDLRTNTSTWLVVMEYINGLEDMRGYYTKRDEPPAKKPRTTNVTTAPPKNPTFNPPPQERRLERAPTSIYNERQMQAMQQRLAAQQLEQQQAFHTVPTARAQSNGTTVRQNGTAPQYAGGVQEKTVNGTKRAANGVAVKSER
jgi:Protein of unknown function DUF262